MIVRKISLLLGFFFLLLIPVWYFVFLPFVIGLPTNYSQRAQLSHTEDNRFVIGSTWSGKTISISESKDVVDKVEYRKARVSSEFKIESLTGENLFLLNQSFLVDRVSLKNLPGLTDISGRAYHIFPRHLKKTNILWWPSFFGGPIDLTYIDSVNLKGINVYHFRGERGDINDTGGYDFLPLVPEMYKVLSSAKLDVFVEPKTGYVVHYEDVGSSFYADQDNKLIWEISKWTNKFTDPTIKEKLENANRLKNKQFFMEVVVPIALLIPAILFLNVGASKVVKKKIVR